MEKKLFILNFILSMFISPEFSFSQVTVEDYRRADNLSMLVADKVLYGSVRPSWIGNTGNFLGVDPPEWNMMGK